MRVLDRFEIKRRGTVITVPYPGGPVPARELNGHYVYLDHLYLYYLNWQITGVETFAKLGPPQPGESIGLLLDDSSYGLKYYPRAGDYITIV